MKKDKSNSEVKKSEGFFKENKELEEKLNKKPAKESEENFEDNKEKPEEEFTPKTGSSNEENSEKENPEEELSKEEMNAIIEEFTTKQNQRFLQFLRDRTDASSSELTNSMLLKSLESQVDEAPKAKTNSNEDDKDKLEYMKYESPDDSKYQSYSPSGPSIENNSDFEKKSSSERILEEQKRFTRDSFGGSYKDELSSEKEYLTTEDIKPDKPLEYKPK